MNYIDTRDVACADCGATYTMGERHVCPYVPTPEQQMRIMAREACRERGDHGNPDVCACYE